MNLLSCKSLRIYYNKYTQRVCLKTDNQWIGISTTNFKILLLLIENSSDFERITFRMNKHDVEILKVGGFIVLSLVGHIYESTILIDSIMYETIKMNIERIKNALTEIH